MLTCKWLQTVDDNHIILNSSPPMCQMTNSDCKQDGLRTHRRTKELHYNALMSDLHAVGKLSERTITQDRVLSDSQNRRSRDTELQEGPRLPVSARVRGEAEL